LIDAARSIEDAVSPEHDLAIAGVAGKGGALLDKGAAEAEAASGGVDEEQAEASGVVGVV